MIDDGDNDDDSNDNDNDDGNNDDEKEDDNDGDDGDNRDDDEEEGRRTTMMMMIVVVVVMMVIELSLSDCRQNSNKLFPWQEWCCCHYYIPQVWQAKIQNSIKSLLLIKTQGLNRFTVKPGQAFLSLTN